MSPSTASPAFDPTHSGTPETQWQAVLERLPLLSLSFSDLLVVSPHPDDEILGAGGLIGTATRAGIKTTLLSVTDGEAAFPDWTQLGEIRRREVRDAMQVVSKPAAIQRLKIPDGRVKEHTASLREAVEQHLSPDTLLVAPFERDGHPDHNATGDVCCQIARLRRTALWRYPIWLWHHGSPQSFAGRAWGRLLLDAEIIEAKLRAIDCFSSQLRPEGRDPVVPAHVLPYFQRRYEVFAT